VTRDSTAPKLEPASDVCASPLPLLPFPRTRADCADIPRPCPFARCRHHLATEVTPRGKLVVIQPDPDQWHGGMCALDIADCGPSTDVEVAEALGIERWSVHRIEERALRKLRRAIKSDLMPVHPEHAVTPDSHEFDDIDEPTSDTCDSFEENTAINQALPEAPGYWKVRYRNRKERGICIACKDDAKPGSVHCEYHARKNCEAWASWREKHGREGKKVPK
jgi:hypothetical protein